jgi:hypothetical protein
MASLESVRVTASSYARSRRESFSSLLTRAKWLRLSGRHDRPQASPPTRFSSRGRARHYRSNPVGAKHRNVSLSRMNGVGARDHPDGRRVHSDPMNTSTRVCSEAWSALIRATAYLSDLGSRPVPVRRTRAEFARAEFVALRPGCRGAPRGRASSRMAFLGTGEPPSPR